MPQRIFFVMLLAFHASPNPQETLRPAAWVNAPATVVDALNTAGCQIPQPVNAIGKVNLIEGRFAHTDQRDWAALCVDDSGLAHIEVVWGRDPLCPLLPQMNLDLSQATITAVSPHRMREYESFYAGFPKHAPLATHDGIEVSANGDNSTIYFCVNGNWAERQGRRPPARK